MNKVVCVGIGSLLTGCMLVNARPAHTGHLYVTVTDFETGEPVTNATATVRAQTEFNIGRTLESYFTKTSAQTDTNGVAHVQFRFYDDDFDWWVESPAHYSRRYHIGYGHESFVPIVVESDYAHIDTNTVDGLAKYNELAQLYSTDYMAYAAKFNPKSITYPSNTVHRSVCLTPKHNPQPMYVRVLGPTNETGEVVSCNYSKIYGPMYVGRRMSFDTMVFNPIPNDSNLESNSTNNLAKTYGHRWARP